MGAGPLLELENLSTHYVSAQGARVVRAVDDVSLRIEAGETLGIVGESGSGKSTLALTILRLLPAAARIANGRMLFEGEDLLQKSEAEMRRLRGQADCHDPVEPDGLAQPAVYHRQPGGGARPGARGRRNVPRHGAGLDLLKARAHRSPQTRLRQYPHEMSGGMRQRIVVPSALLRAALLIADEPTTASTDDPGQYLNLLRELQRAHGLALIFITHNLGIVAKMCDQLAVMYAGRVVESGPVRQIFNTPAHPYTQALLNSIPRMGDSSQRLTAIDGQPPDLIALPPGCAFAPRCPSAFDRCREAAPPEITTDDGARALLVRVRSRDRQRQCATRSGLMACSRRGAQQTLPGPAWAPERQRCRACGGRISFAMRAGRRSVGRRSGCGKTTRQPARARGAHRRRHTLRGRIERARHRRAGTTADPSRPCSRPLCLAQSAHARGAIIAEPLFTTSSLRRACEEAHPRTARSSRAPGRRRISFRTSSPAAAPAHRHCPILALAEASGADERSPPSMCRPRPDPDLLRDLQAATWRVHLFIAHDLAAVAP